MIATYQCTVLDCPDPLGLARFYERLLGGEVNRPDRRWAVDGHWATLHLPGGQVLCFQRVGDHRPPRWPDAGHPQQAHLDFHVPDVAAAEPAVLAAGATALTPPGGPLGWRVYADPAGHPFCLVPG